MLAVAGGWLHVGNGRSTAACWQEQEHNCMLGDMGRAVGFSRVDDRQDGRYTACRRAVGKTEARPIMSGSVQSVSAPMRGGSAAVACEETSRRKRGHGTK